MHTETLCTLTAQAAARMKGARLWPNKLGFDTPGGWMISYSERAGQWFAGRRLTNGRRRFAYAETPEAALDKARTPGQYTEEED